WQGGGRSRRWTWRSGLDHRHLDGRRRSRSQVDAARSEGRLAARHDAAAEGWRAGGEAGCGRRPVLVERHREEERVSGSTEVVSPTGGTTSAVAPPFPQTPETDRQGSAGTSESSERSGTVHR